MGIYVVKRLIGSIAVLLGASVFIFTLIRLTPGDSVYIMLYGPFSAGNDGDQEMVSQEALDRIREELGLNKPLVHQYFEWIRRVIRFDLGISFRNRQPVIDELFRRLPATALLAFSAFGIEIVLALTFGILSAVRAGSMIDHATRLSACLLKAVPSFWLGLLLLYLFVLKIGWISVTGDASFRRVILPAFTLGLVAAPRLMRVLRASMLAELDRLYLVFGRAQGIKESYLILQHAFRNAVLPIVTLLGMSLSHLLSGSVVIETVFSWPGIGKYVMDSIHVRDYPVVQGYVLFTTVIVVFMNLLVDLSYTLLDPRVRLGRKTS